MCINKYVGAKSMQTFEDFYGTVLCCLEGIENQHYEEFQWVHEKKKESEMELKLVRSKTDSNGIRELWNWGLRISVSETFSIVFVKFIRSMNKGFDSYGIGRENEKVHVTSLRQNKT